MTKAELVKAIKAKAGLSSKAAAENALDSVLQVITKALAKGDKVTFTGFGSFTVVKRKARAGRNPKTGKAIKIPARNSIKFKAGKLLKKAVK